MGLTDADAQIENRKGVTMGGEIRQQDFNYTIQKNEKVSIVKRVLNLHKGF